MTSDGYPIWTLIVLMGLGTFAIRFSFLGLIGDRKLPDWVLRHLRYTPVAVIPALIAPAVIWPAATGGETDPARLLSILTCLGVGYVTRNLLAAVGSGIVCLLLVQALL